MKASKVGLAFVLFVALISPAISIAADPNSFAICKKSGSNQISPAVSGDNVVWTDKRTGVDIYHNDPTKVKDANGFLLAAATNDQKNPAISGNNVVWQDYRDGTSNSNIYRCLLPSTSALQVCINTSGQENPAVSGNTIVWQDNRSGNWNIYGYTISGSSGTEFPICADAGDQDSPAIDGNIVVWRDYGTGETDIRGKNLGNGHDIAIQLPGVQQNPAVSGNVVVWEDQRTDPNADIYGKDIVTDANIAICVLPGKQSNPAISGDIVVWQDQRSGNYDIYGYKISTRTTFPICTSLSSNQQNPAISGNLVVWEDYRNGSSNADIYGAYVPDLSNSVKIIGPDGGQMLLAGSEYMISWQDSVPSAGSVKLEYSVDGGQSFVQIAQNVSASPYSWQIPANIDSTQCLIRVSGPDISDASNQFFTIFKCDATLTGDANHDCLVDFADFAIMSSQWLICGNKHDPKWCN